MQIHRTKGLWNELLTPNVVGGPGGIVGVMYLRNVGYIKVFTPAP